ncbi:TonB-dependent receptor [Phenylobacterium sp.]|uniref:TonB-dependent receptor n=1 Tax=Phenylobacterium sp. TaxID=1871053 RepID=UPI002FC6C0C0
MDEIVVTARKREERLQQTPVAVTALGGEALEQRAVSDLADLSATVPNLALRAGGGASGAGFTPAIAIRGIGQVDFTINTDPAVGVYLDEVYLGRSLGAALDLVDIERVEVLRGPQGTLFGRNTIGGAVSVIARAPAFGERPSGRLSLAVGERAFAKAQASVNLPLADRAALRLSAFHRRRDGYVDALQYRDLKLGGEEVWGLRAALRFEPARNARFDLTADLTERRDPPAPVVALRLGGLSDSSPAPTGANATFFNSGRGPVGIARVPFISPDAPRCALDVQFRAASRTCYGDAWLTDGRGSHSVWTDRAGAPITPSNTLRTSGQSLTGRWESPVGRLKLISSHRQFSSTFYNDFDFTPHVVFHNNNAPYKQEQWSHEIQLVGGGWNGAVDYVIGGYLFEERGAEYVDQLTPGDVPVALANALAPALPYFQTTGRIIDNRSTAIFGQLTLNPTARLHLTGGLRWTDEAKDYRVEQVRAAGPPQRAAGSQRSRIWTPSVNLAYELTPDSLVYVSYAEGYRAGGFASRFPGGLPTPLPTYDPEFVAAYELGLKSAWFGRRLVLNLAAFRSDYDDIQVSAAVPNLPGFTLNLASAEITGFEAEARLQLSERLKLEVSVGRTAKQLTEVAPGTTSGGGTNVAVPITSRSRLPGPDWQASAALGYERPLANGGRLRSRLDVRYESEDAGAVANYPISVREPYAVADASLTLVAPDGWDFSLGARNILDARYFTAKALSPAAGSAYGVLARPRELFVAASRSFGQ